MKNIVKRVGERLLVMVFKFIHKPVNYCPMFKKVLLIV